MTPFLQLVRLPTTILQLSARPILYIWPINIFVNKPLARTVQDGLPDIPTLYVSSKATVKGQAFAIRFLNAVILQQQEGLRWHSIPERTILPQFHISVRLSLSTHRIFAFDQSYFRLKITCVDDPLPNSGNRRVKVVYHRL